MNLIKSFQITILLIALSSCDIILHDYGNGNRGAGINDQVNGKNNTWIGNTNSINGDVNKVVGNDNKINGSNNIVQGNGNVVGDMSPEQLAKLQNQMFASFQDRFNGMFNFGSPPSQSHPIQKPPQDNTNVSKIQENKTEEASNNQSQVSKIVPAQMPQKASLPKEEAIIPQDHHMPSRQDRVMLVFRSFGKQFREMIHEQIFNLEESLSASKQKILCERWNYCLNNNRNHRWFFTSAYPTILD